MADRQFILGDELNSIGVSYSRRDVPNVVFWFAFNAIDKKHRITCNNGPLFACSIILKDPNIKADSVIKKYKKEFPDIKHSRKKQTKNKVEQYIKGNKLYITIIQLSEILENQDVKITISYNDVEYKFQANRKLSAEEKQIINSAINQTKSAMPNLLQIKIIDKKLKNHFLQFIKKAEVQAKKAQAAAAEKAAEKALDF